MNHNEFEKNMMDFVNASAKEADKRFAETAQAAFEDWKRCRAEQRRKAKVELFCWIPGFLAISILFGTLASMGSVPAGWATGITSVFGLVSGVRMCALARVL